MVGQGASRLGRGALRHEGSGNGVGDGQGARVRDAGGSTPPPGPPQGEALVLQTAGYQAILHSQAGGYRSHVLTGGRWTVWHSTARQGAFPPLPPVDWQQGPTQAYYMSADPWPLAVLLHTVGAPN